MEIVAREEKLAQYLQNAFAVDADKPVLIDKYVVGKEIEVWRDDEEDVLLSEFSNEIDEWVIERLESIGCDTAKSVLAFTPEDIAKRADLEDETVAEVFRILKAEFED